MKIGVRKPNIKKRVKARTTGRLKRAAKKSVNPLYGKKGMGLINNPKKAVYNKVYDKTSISVDNVAKTITSSPEQPGPSPESTKAPKSLTTKNKVSNLGCFTGLFALAAVVIICLSIVDRLNSGLLDQASRFFDSPVLKEINVNFQGDFNGDETGRWKKAQVTTMRGIQDYALDYYKKYFKSDDEVHVIYNRSLNTANRLAIKNETLLINVSDYVIGEENNVKEACKGSPISSSCIDIASGEVLFSNTVDSQKLSSDEVEEIFNPTEATTETTTQSSTEDNTTHRSFPEYQDDVTTTEITYIINVDSNKFHAINGPDTDTILPTNRVETSMSWDELINEGYEPCGRCF